MRPSSPGALGLAIILCWFAASSAADLDDIYNYHRIDTGLHTAGQVTPAQIPDLDDQGIGMVVNLAVADAERNGEEALHVAEQGIAYVQIPVAWDNPTLNDLDLFFAVMDARGDRPVLVHCFANYRASAFTYLYRTLRLGVPEDEARAGLDAIWSEAAFDENPQWRAFMKAARDRHAAMEVGP